jgi:hypothetical protein
MYFYSHVTLFYNEQCCIIGHTNLVFLLPCNTATASLVLYSHTRTKLIVWKAYGIAGGG